MSGSRPARARRLTRRGAYLGFLVCFVALVAYLTWHGPSSAAAPAAGEIHLRRPYPSDGLSRKTTTILMWWGWFLALAAAPLGWRAARIGRPAPRVAAAVLLVLAGGAVAAVTEHLLARRWIGAPPFPVGYLLAPVPLVLASVPFVIMVLAVYLLKTRDDEIVLRAELAESRLGALTAQLQPHFLFNTLQAISSALHRDPAAADRMVGGLGDLLRSALEGSRAPVVPLERELDLLESYLAIMRERFGDRVTVTVDVAPELARAQVPVLLLQPLVENAFRHGVEAREGPAEIRITAHRTADRLILEVGDDGSGPPAPAGSGTGLANSRERLAALYGDAARLRVSGGSPRGTLVTVEVPFRSAR